MIEFTEQQVKFQLSEKRGEKEGKKRDASHFSATLTKKRGTAEKTTRFAYFILRRVP
jgi:hypothetical protein